MLKEFKEFALKGNVMDLAIGVVIGAAFGKVVTSLVEDVITPPLGLLLGKVDFSNLFFSLSLKHYSTLAQAKQAGAATINYGLFLNSLINFLIVSGAIFIVVKQINKLRRNAHEPSTRCCPACFNEVHTKAVKCGHCTVDLNIAKS